MTSASTAVASTTPPRSSRRALCERDSGTTRPEATSAKRPIGTLIKKTERQPRCSTSSAISPPPMIWPVIDARPWMLPCTPITRRRCPGAKWTWMIESTCGHIAAPAKPCSSRPAISALALGAAAQSAEAAVKPATPILNSRRRPKMSPSRPAVINETA